MLFSLPGASLQILNRTSLVKIAKMGFSFEVEGALHCIAKHSEFTLFDRGSDFAASARVIVVENNH